MMHNDENAIKVCIGIFVFLINEEKGTSSILNSNTRKSTSYNDDILIPSSISYKSKKYVINSIFNKAFIFSRIKSISFLNNSELDIIYPMAFFESSIETIEIPIRLTKICEKAFYKCPNLRTVSIPKESSLQIIESNAFQNTSITSILIPSHVKRIQNSAFFECVKLKQVEFMENSELQIIESNAFRNTSISKISIPSNLEEICESAFSGCKELKYFIIPNDSKLRLIEKDAFLDTMIANFLIPSKLIQLNKDFLRKMNNLIRLEILPNNPKYSFFDNNFIIEKSNQSKNSEYDTLNFSLRNIKEAKIPSFIKFIGPYAFENCKKILGIDFYPDSKIQQFGKMAFSCSSIIEITIPSSLLCIGKYSFCKCTNLQRIKFAIDSQLQVIEEGAFCLSSIIAISIPSSVKHLCKKTFSGCNKLRSVKIQEDSQINVIEEEVFKDTSINYFYLPPHITQISQNAFLSCTRLKKIEVPENSELKTIRKNAFSGTLIESFDFPSCLIDLQNEWGNGATKLININVSPKNPSYFNYKNQFLIGKSSPNKDNYDVLSFCFNNIENVIIPSFIKIIGSYSFYDNNVKYLTFAPDSKLYKIEKNAFEDVIIKCIVFPSNLHFTYLSIFTNCKSFQIIDISQCCYQNYYEIPDYILNFQPALLMISAGTKLEIEKPKKENCDDLIFDDYLIDYIL